MSFYDYLSIAFYFAFIVGIGVYFSRQSKDTSDYFRGGGVVPWWITGASAWMAGFSAWTFTGAAGKVYETGLYVLGLYYANLIPLVLLLLYTSYRFRRMRVVTPLEAVRMRFGAQSQQFYTWIRLPILIVFMALGLNAIGVFMAAVFNLNLMVVLMGLGVIVTFVSLLGGSVGVAASDFVQMFLLVTVAIVLTVLVLALPEIGGITGLVEKIPSNHINLSETARPEFIVLWVLALAFNGVFNQNSMENSAKYLMAASDRQARLTLLIPLFGTVVGPLFWFVPPMSAAVLYPDMSTMFPQLRYPEEASYLATALKVLPQGMLGLLICSIFAASLTDLSGNLNLGSGIFVRNFYLAVLRPSSPDRALLIISRVTAAILGVLVTVIAIAISQFRSAGLFDLINQFAISLILPLSVPLFLGLFFKHTPPWSTWSTVLLGLGVSFFIKYHSGPELLGLFPALGEPFKPEERVIYPIFATVAAVLGISSAWFFFTSLFYDRTTAEFKESVNEFFRRQREPVPAPVGDRLKEDYKMALSVGRLCLIYGLFVLLLALVPNSMSGRACFLFCGGVMAGVGLIVGAIYSRKDRALSRRGGTSPEY